jgi:hypothetical protein
MKTTTTTTTHDSEDNDDDDDNDGDNDDDDEDDDDDDDEDDMHVPASGRALARRPGSRPAACPWRWAAPSRRRRGGRGGR